MFGKAHQAESPSAKFAKFLSTANKREQERDRAKIQTCHYNGHSVTRRCNQASVSILVSRKTQRNQTVGKRLGETWLLSLRCPAPPKGSEGFDPAD